MSRTYLPLAPRASLSMTWFDPTATGLPLNLANNSARQLLLPFPVRFYGRVYNEIWVSDNGLATFNQPYTGTLTSGCLPSASRPNNAIYVLWEDLNPSLGGQVYAHRPDSDRFVITWLQTPRVDGTRPQSFQLVLMRDGRLVFQYLSIQTPVQALIGAENYDGVAFRQLRCAGVGQPVRSGDAFVVQPRLPWE